MGRSAFILGIITENVCSWLAGSYIIMPNIRIGEEENCIEVPLQSNLALSEY